MGEGERPQGHEGGGKRRRRGGDDSEGWSTSDAELEEAKEGPAAPTASPCGTQESGASRLRRGARAGGSDGGKATSGMADGGETRRRHGAGKHHGGEKGGRQGGECDNPWGVGGKSGGREASGVGPDPHRAECEEGGCEASRVAKNLGRVRHGVAGGVELSPDDSTRQGEGRGVESSWDDLTPTGGGRGGSSHGRMT